MNKMNAYLPMLFFFLLSLGIGFTYSYYAPKIVGTDEASGVIDDYR